MKEPLTTCPPAVIIPPPIAEATGVDEAIDCLGTGVKVGLGLGFDLVTNLLTLLNIPILKVYTVYYLNISFFLVRFKKDQ